MLRLSMFAKLIAFELPTGTGNTWAQLDRCLPEWESRLITIYMIARSLILTKIISSRCLPWPLPAQVKDDIVWIPSTGIALKCSFLGGVNSLAHNR